MGTKELGLELATINKKSVEIQSKIMAATASFQHELTLLQEKDAAIRVAIKEAMEQSATKKYEDDNILIIYIAETTRRGFDAKAMAVKHPKIYKQFEKITPVKSSVRIAVKK